MATVWNAVFEGLPAGDEDPSDGDNRIRTGKTAISERMRNEHTDYVGDATAGNYLLDWNHRAGSAKAYFQNAAPTNRPNDSTALGAADKGRLWFDDDNSDIPYYFDGANWVGMDIVVARFSIQGAMATGQNVIPPIIFPYGCEILEVQAYLVTAPTGAAFHLDLEINGDAGESIFAAAQEYLLIDDAANADDSSFTIDNGTLTAAQRLHVDIVQVGSTTPGSDLSVSIAARLG